MSTQIIERMAVEVDGDGEPVIMIHGLGGTSNTWTPQMGVYGGRFRVVRPDLAGAGRSPASGPLSIGGFVEAVAGMADVLGIERAHFLGHSMGTIVCQHLAVEYPRLVRSLALFGPFPEPPEQARQGLRDRAAKARADGMADIADTIVQGSTSGETRERNPVAAALVREMLMRQPAEGYALNCEALAEARAADLSRVNCPVMLVSGDEDRVAPPQTVRAMDERLSRSHSMTLGRCGHWATFEKVEEVNRALRDFMSSRI